jgi:hypothetical protein
VVNLTWQPKSGQDHAALNKAGCGVTKDQNSQADADLSAWENLKKKNLKFSSIFESFVNVDNQVLTCEKQSIEGMLPGQQRNQETDEHEEDKHE